MDANIESYFSLQEFVRSFGRNLNEIPLVFQLNKSDLPNILSPQAINFEINISNEPFYETVAARGLNVMESFQNVADLIINEQRLSNYELNRELRTLSNSELSKILVEDISFQKRSCSAVIIGERKDSETIPFLVKALDDENFSVRVNSVYSLGEIGDKSVAEALINKLNDEVESVRFAVIRTLGKLGDKTAIHPLCEKLLSPENPNLRVAIIEQLTILPGENIVEPIIFALNDENSQIKFKAIEALGRIGDNKAVEPLIEAANTKDSFLRAEIAEALGRIGDEKAIPLLEELIKDDNWNVRNLAKSAINTIRKDESQPIELFLESPRKKDNIFISFIKSFFC